MLERALSQLPGGAANPGTLVRCDSAGATHAFLDAVVARGLLFSVGCDLSGRVREAILALPGSAWAPALDAGGVPRDGAWVTELDGHRFQVMLTNQKGSRIARLEALHR